MKKRIAALILAVILVLSALTACHDKQINGDDINGAEIRLYLGELTYELDPSLCMNNDSALQICSLLYDTLFKIDAKGKLQNSLVKSYKIIEDEKNEEYYMLLTLRDDTFWTNGNNVSANDVVFTWKRILNAENNSDAAALLYDIKDAKAAKAGDVSIDDVGIYAVDMLVLQITFDHPIDYEAFLYNLASVALAPLSEQEAGGNNADWSKKPATTVSSGPFMLRRVNYGFDTENNPDTEYASFILERNPFYRRVPKEAKYVDTSVAPFRLIIDFSHEQQKEVILQNFEAAENYKDAVYYVGDIALSKRDVYKDKATVKDSMSTHSYYFNENADIKKADGTTEKLFADKNIRLALSACIDRNAIAEAIVFARPADAFVPYGVFETTSAKKLFRQEGGSLISTAADTSAAQQYIAASGKKPSDYTFSIMVNGTDEVHCAIADKVCDAWCALGFNVTVNKLMPEVNDEKLSGEDVKDIYDDIFSERFYANDYQVAAVDVIASAPYATSFLAPFATGYSGQGQDMSAENLLDATPSKCGYVNDEYNKKIAEVFTKTSYADRAPILHEAEKLLMEDMAVMPVIFNQTATLCSADLSNVTIDWFGAHDFTQAKQKDWINYIETTEAPNKTEAP